MKIPVTVISDCRDSNAACRITSRLAALVRGFVPGGFIGVKNDLEAAGNLVDILDAYQDHRAAILVNVAPRDGKGKHWKNGSPFGRLRVGKVDIFSTVDGYVLSLLKKLLGQQLIIEMFDIAASLPFLGISKHQYNYVCNTQFRSFEFLPRLAAALLNRPDRNIPSTVFSNIPEVPQAVWCVDTFGNLKTTLLPEDISFYGSSYATMEIGEKGHDLLPCYEYLSEVPIGQTAVVIGSSGLWVDGGNCRLVEVVKCGGSAAEEFGVKVGSSVERARSLEFN